MSKKNDGGSAYPCVGYEQQGSGQGVSIMTITGGMSLRDAMAIAAMQGLIAQSNGTALNSKVEIASEYAYRMADSMLIERDK